MKNWMRYLGLGAITIVLCLFALAAALKTSEFSFTKKIWLRWYCLDISGAAPKVEANRPVGQPGHEYEIECATPVRYHAKINGLGVRSTGADPADWSHIDVALFGCSYTFGTSLTDDQTIASQLQQILPGKVVVNFASPGAGPARALSMLWQMKEKKLPVGDIGAVVFTFRDGHYVRDTGKGRWFFHPTNPQFSLTGDKYDFLGTYARNDIDYHASMVGILTRFFVDVFHLILTNEDPTNDDVQFTAKIINAMYLVTTRQLNTKFYLNIWPEKGAAVEARRALLLSLLRPEIQVLDIGHPLKLDPVGRHPTPVAAQKMAEFLKERVTEN